jgi:hypothetical protein
VADDNLGMFGITEMAMKIADAPLPGAPHHRDSKQGKNPEAYMAGSAGAKGRFLNLQGSLNLGGRNRS